MRTSQLFAAGVLALASPSGLAWAPQEVDRSAALGARLEAIVTEARDRLGLEGLSLTALVGSEELLSQGYGHFNGQPASATTLLPAGPTIELLLIAGALELANNKKIELDSPLTALFPKRKLPFTEVTLVQLLTHTSGLANVPENHPVEAAASKDGAPAETDPDLPDAEPWLTWLCQQAPSAEANTCVQWSNADLLLLDLWLRENNAQGKLAEYEAVLPPDDADLWLPISRSYGLGRMETGLLPARLAGPQAVLSTSDIALRLKALLKEDTLGPNSSARLMQVARLKDGESTGRTAGFTATTLGTYAGFGFGGTVEGHSTHGVYYPALDLILTVSAQGSGVSLVALQRSLTRAIFDLEQPVMSDLPLSAEELAQLAGTYKIGCDTLTLTIVEGRLWLQTTELNLSFAYQGGGRFHAQGDSEMELEFTHRGEGQAQSFILSSEGLQAIARRFQ